jgi:multiple sugar transport system substrate-binding protein
LSIAAVAAFARPYIANAAATIATAWWVQGFAEEEDISFKKIVADYARATGNTTDYSIIPYAPERQKIVSAMTSGVVPDLFQNNPAEIIALYAWEDKLVDVSDVVETQRREYTDTALLTVRCYNNVEKKRSFYDVPYTCAVRPNHIWRPLVERAGYTMEDLPRTWDALLRFLQGCAEEIARPGRAQSLRHRFSDEHHRQRQQRVVRLFPNRLSWPGHRHQGWKTAPGRAQGARSRAQRSDLFDHGLQGRLCAPRGRSIGTTPTTTTPSFHAKQIVMDLDGTISTEVAVKHNEQDYRDIATIGLPLSNDGKPVPSQAPSACGLIPKGAKNVVVAKDFLKCLIQPQVLNEYLKTGLGRNIPCMPSIVKDDPWWLDPNDPHRRPYVQQGLLGPTLSTFWTFNPAYAQVQNEHVWPTAWADITTGGMTPQAAADKAFKRVEEIFAKYPIAQG